MLALVALGGLGGCAFRASEMLLHGDVRRLRERPDGAPVSSPDRPGVLLIAIDGVDRRLLYAMLRAGELPALSALLGGGDAGRFPHAHLDDSLLATLPSSTMVAWVTAMTGVEPARHGITGNEFFIRERRQFAAPVPVSIDDTTHVLACFTDDYVDRLTLAPSVYERMRMTEPDLLVWVAMHQYHAGADWLLLPDRTVIAKASEAFLEEQIAKLQDEESRVVFEKLDGEVIDVVTDRLAREPLPDVLTVYLAGTDSYAHVAEQGPDASRREYLREVLDPLLGRLADRLRERRALDDRWVVVTSDHGHTAVKHDDAHALSMDGEQEPPALLAKAGFRVRPFRLEVPEDADFQAVLAYQGAMAFVYLADRSTCAEPGQACDWTRAPRFREDVLRVADAFYANNGDGTLVPGLRGTLDMVLARRPHPVPEVDAPFEVYVGDGQLVPVAQYLARHPHPDYVQLEARLRDLAVGPHGERAGDVILLAHNGDRREPEGRYYFASRYRSWHGSPSRQDSEIPLIVAHPRRSSGEISRLVRRAIGSRPAQQDVTDVLLGLRSASTPTIERAAR